MICTPRWGLALTKFDEHERHDRPRSHSFHCSLPWNSRLAPFSFAHCSLLRKHEYRRESELGMQIHYILFLVIFAGSQAAISPDGRCGRLNNDYSCLGTAFGDCCSSYGYLRPTWSWNFYFYSLLLIASADLSMSFAATVVIQPMGHVRGMIVSFRQRPVLVLLLQLRPKSLHALLYRPGRCTNVAWQLRRSDAINCHTEVSASCQTFLQFTPWSCWRVATARGFLSVNWMVNGSTSSLGSLALQELPPRSYIPWFDAHAARTGALYYWALGEGYCHWVLALWRFTRPSLTTSVLLEDGWFSTRWGWFWGLLTCHTSRLWVQERNIQHPMSGYLSPSWSLH